MTRIVLDTNVVLRLIVKLDPQHNLVSQAVKMLGTKGDTVQVLAQSVVEAAGALTRPMSSNGFGLSLGRTELEISTLEAVFDILPDIPEVYVNWRRLFATIGASGRQVHDMRIAAAMSAHGIDHILTFDADDFKRYTDITVVHPSDVVATQDHKQI